MSEGRLFAPYKALGLICGTVPLVLRRHPKRRFTAVLCAVGNVVHQYNAQSLRLISVSDDLGGDVNCLAANNLYVFAGVGSTIFALHLSRQIKHTYSKPDQDHAVIRILPFGVHVVSVDSSCRLTVWDIEEEVIYAEMVFDPENFRISTMCHPATYLNKILLGSFQGEMKLVNLKTGKQVYEFSGWNSPVVVMEQSPAVDVLGIGLEDGRILLHNLKFDQSLLEFKQDWGEVCRLTFRTDGPPVLITSSKQGHLAVWDLEKQTLIGQMHHTHKSAVTGLQCLQTEPIFVTSGPDNALRTWIFDLPDGLARQLAEREGHSKAPTVVRFHGSDGEMLLCAGLDSTVRMFSTWKDTKQQNLGTAGTMSRKKAKAMHKDPESVRLPPITCLSSETVRENAWDNITCCHRSSLLVTTWTSKRQRLGTHKLMHKRFESQEEYRTAVATCCSVTACGNFTLIGYSSGHVDLWNVQSGLFRGTFEDKKSTVVREGQKGRAHANSVKGICSDAFNQKMVSGCEKGELKFWRFKAKVLTRSVQLESGVSKFELHRENSLLAVALENRTVLVVDVECGRPVRKFISAHREGVVDLAFSSSGHWLVSVGEDGTVKVWDLPTAALVEVLPFSYRCTAVAMSPTGEYLATCHENRKGVYLWANKTVYSPGTGMKPLPLDYTPATPIDLPSTNQHQEVEEVVVGDEEAMEVDENAREEQEQISEDLVTLSGLPAVHWAHLLDLDTIRQRNKPKEPPKKPKAAPFFLPTVSSLKGFSFDTTNKGDIAGAEKSGTLKSKISIITPKTDFVEKLEAADTQWKRLEVFEKLKQYPPGKIDTEIRTLSLVSGGCETVTLNFLRMISEVLGSRKDFELAQSYLGLFLKVHRDVLWKDRSEGEQMSEVEQELEKLLSVQKSSWEKVDSLMDSSLCLIEWLKSSVV